MTISPERTQQSRIPLYVQTAKLMRQKIERQEWRLGDQIPTLVQLEELYKVSRITLRGALDYLEESGIVRRERGRGTFVTRDLSEERWYKLPNTLDELIETVSGLKVELLQVGASDEPPIPAFAFGTLGDAYRYLRRVHYHDRQPYCLIDLYLRKSLFESDPEGFLGSPAVAILAKRPDVRIAGAKQIMRIGVAQEETAAYLHIGVGEPVAEVCRTFVDDSGEIFYYAHIIYPTQTIQIETDLLGASHREAKP
ncbi:GntR family transcriptional regulator [Castellaniella sp. UC4442_H9]|jgi:GntR family transcriptional regulator